jgi:CRISPR-associated endonuclease Cas2
MAGHYLIAYDVKNNKRRRRAAKIAYAYALGGQKSALESVLEKDGPDILAERLYVKIKPQEDKVNIIQVMPKAILLGRAKQLDFSEGMILL